MSGKVAALVAEKAAEDARVEAVAVEDAVAVDVKVEVVVLAAVGPAA